MQSKSPEEFPSTDSTVRDRAPVRARIIAVDFDGVIASYDGWDGEQLGHPRPDTIQALRILRGEGWRIIVYSCRDEKLLLPYLQRHEVPFDEVNPGSKHAGLRGKPVATVYWDDRAHRYSGDALKDLEEIRNFRTWSGRP